MEIPHFYDSKNVECLVELQSEIDRFFHGLVRKMKIKSYIHF